MVPAVVSIGFNSETNSDIISVFMFPADFTMYRNDIDCCFTNDLSWILIISTIILRLYIKISRFFILLSLITKIRLVDF